MRGGSRSTNVVFGFATSIWQAAQLKGAGCELFTKPEVKLELECALSLRDELLEKPDVELLVKLELSLSVKHIDPQLER